MSHDHGKRIPPTHGQRGNGFEHAARALAVRPLHDEMIPDIDRIRIRPGEHHLQKGKGKGGVGLPVLAENPAEILRSFALESSLEGDLRQLQRVQGEVGLTENFLALHFGGEMQGQGVAFFHLPVRNVGGGLGGVSALIPAEGISLLGAVPVGIGQGFGGVSRGDTIVVKPPPGHGLRVQGGRQAEGQKTR